MSPASRFRRKESVAERRIAGECFLVPVCGDPGDMENIFVLNPVAAFIWQRLDGGHPLRRIQEEIAEEFDVSGEQAGADAEELIGQLLARGLVEEIG